MVVDGNLFGRGGVVADFVGVVARSGTEPASRNLAERFKWPLLEKYPRSGFYLSYDDQGLALYAAGTRQKPLLIDFRETLRRRTGKQDLFARSLGVRLGVQKLVDLTMGLGRDAMMALLLGCQVVGVERSPIVFALLEDALSRGLNDHKWSSTLERLTLHFGEAKEYLLKLNTNPLDAALIDPMFPPMRKSALAKREMQMLQKLLNETDEAQELLHLMRPLSCRRIIIKRPLHASLLDPAPDLQFKGKAIRYDVWL